MANYMDTSLAKILDKETEEIQTTTEHRPGSDDNILLKANIQQKKTNLDQPVSGILGINGSHKYNVKVNGGTTNAGDSSESSNDSRNDSGSGKKPEDPAAVKKKE